MAIAQTYTFDTAANFVTDLGNGAVIDETANVGRLGRTPDVGNTFTQDFTSDVGFTYNPVLAAFLAGAVSQIDQTTAVQRLGATFSSFNANWNKDGAVTGFLNGTPTIVANKLRCLPGPSEGLYYDTVSSQQGAIKVKYTPNYTGGPIANRNVVGFQNGVGTPHRFVLTHSPSGNTFRLTLNDSAGTSIFTAQVIGPAWLPTTGVEYELEVNWNSITGTTQIFIDGVLHGTRNDAPWAMNNGDPIRLYMGGNPSIYNTADATYDDLMYFNTVQHTVGYAPGYVVPLNIYETSQLTLPLFSYLGVGNIVAIQSMTVTEIGSPRYIIQGQYWNGAAWVASDDSYAQATSLADFNTNIAALVPSPTGVLIDVIFPSGSTLASVDDLVVTYTGERYHTLGFIEPASPIQSNLLISYLEDTNTIATTDIKILFRIDNVLTWYNTVTLAWETSDGSSAQANTAAEVNANFATLVLGSSSTVYPRWILSTSDDGNTPTIVTSTVNYNFGSVPTESNVCLIHGHLRDVRGQPLAGIRVDFEISFTGDKYYKESTNTIVSPQFVSVFSNSLGYFEVNLVWSSEFEDPTTQYRAIFNFKKVLKETNVIETKEVGELTFLVPDSSFKDITELLPAP